MCLLGSFSLCLTQLAGGKTFPSTWTVRTQSTWTSAATGKAFNVATRRRLAETSTASWPSSAPPPPPTPTPTTPARPPPSLPADGRRFRDLPIFPYADQLEGVVCQVWQTWKLLQVCHQSEWSQGHQRARWKRRRCRWRWSHVTATRTWSPMLVKIFSEGRELGACAWKCVCVGGCLCKRWERQSKREIFEGSFYFTEQEIDVWRIFTQE